MAGRKEKHILKAFQQNSVVLWLHDAPNISSRSVGCARPHVYPRRHCRFALKAFGQMKWWPSLTECNTCFLPMKPTSNMCLLIKPFMKTFFWFVSPLQAYSYWDERVYQKKRVTAPTLFRNASEVLVGHDCHQPTVCLTLRKQVQWLFIRDHTSAKTPSTSWWWTLMLQGTLKHLQIHTGQVETYQLSKVGVFKYCLTSSDTSRELQMWQHKHEWLPHIQTYNI